jgi:hypothetical protein
VNDLEAKAKELEHARNIFWENYKRKMEANGFDHPRTRLARALYNSIMVRYYATMAEVHQS